MSLPERITVWACPKCGYWRQDKSTGVHQTVNPEDMRGRMLIHELQETTYELAQPS